MFNELEDILRDLSHGLMLLSIPVNILYFSLMKIDKKLDKKLGEKDDYGRNFVWIFMPRMGNNLNCCYNKGKETFEINK